MHMNYTHICYCHGSSECVSVFSPYLSFPLIKTKLFRSIWQRTALAADITGCCFHFPPLHMLLCVKAWFQLSFKFWF